MQAEKVDASEPDWGTRFRLVLRHYALENKKELARAAGISGQAVAQLVSGVTKNPSGNVLRNILQKWPEISPDWLLRGVGPRERSIESIPLEGEDEQDYSSSQRVLFGTIGHSVSYAREAVGSAYDILRSIEDDIHFALSLPGVPMGSLTEQQLLRLLNSARQRRTKAQDKPATESISEDELQRVLAFVRDSLAGEAAEKRAKEG